MLTQPVSHPYRDCLAAKLSHNDQGKTRRLAGWVSHKRDHGQLLFIDLRDQSGLIQLVFSEQSPLLATATELSLESVISVVGTLRLRSADTVNPNLPSGDVELHVHELQVLSAAEPLPIPVSQKTSFPEELRYRYRYLDLRRDVCRQLVVLRTEVIQFLRQQMLARDFIEFQTPILAAPSPEGARDFLVPSRLHRHRFYALPQAPQQYKQLLMMSGFDRYFQIAPCFRDEDARADRSPGEFYQLDFEMAFVTQDDVFAVVEPVLYETFCRFANKATVTQPPFTRLRYAEAISRYGTDKPDLRNPLEITDVSEAFAGSGFALFANRVAKKEVVLAIAVRDTASRPRRFFDQLNQWAREQGQAGLGYMTYSESQSHGPIAKNLEPEALAQLHQSLNSQSGDAIFFICGQPNPAHSFAALVRDHLGQQCELIDATAFAFCWITDFPMFERDPVSGAWDFSHNPFSMPQGGLEALEQQDPEIIKAWQYDIVCNGVELSSGAIRNHRPDIMAKAFAIAGYSQQDLEQRFGGMLTALRYGAPPHGGAAPGIDRMVMLLSGQSTIRESVAFPLTQSGQDLMLGAPGAVHPTQLAELGLKPTR